MSKRRSSQTSKGFSSIVEQYREAHGGEQPLVVKGTAPGKPVGKSADPNYTKLTCYIRKETHLKTKKKLLDEGDLEFSDVIEELLSGWLKK